MNIKPIETVYNGYRFRSRLEARWAVFFDASWIEYRYEPEGFNLYGEYYLPDFYLPEFDLFVEIKPFDRTIVHHVGDGNKWEEKCANFRDATGHAILLCYGDPSSDSYKKLFAFDCTDSSCGTSNWDCLFVEHYDKILLVTEPTSRDRDICTRNDMIPNDKIGASRELSGDERLLWDKAHILYDPQIINRLNYAKTKARQARFEHGENPFI